MSYPNFINYNNLNDIFYFKSYDIKIIERNCIYPFTYTNNKTINKNIDEYNDFIQLPNFDNLTLDKNGLPFIPLQ